MFPCTENLAALQIFRAAGFGKLAAGWLYGSLPFRQDAPSFGCAFASRPPQDPMV